MYDIITVGSNTLDVFAKTDAELIEIRDSKKREELIAYPLGSKILITDLQFMVGGSAVNTGVTFARLGLKTGYLGKIGKDENGLKVFKELKDEKIDFLGTLGNMTGYSIILDSLEEDRTLLSYKGCNNNLTFEELNLRKLDSNWFYFASMMSKSFKMMKKLALYAKKKHIKIGFNASPYLAKKGFSELKPILENTTVLVLNKEEAELLAGKGELIDMLRRLKVETMKYVVITDGKNGATCYDGKHIYKVKPTKKLKIKETTGAGDAFASSFIAGIIMKKPIEECLKIAAINSESVIQNYGAKNILLKKKVLLERLKKDKRPVLKRKV